MYDNNGNLTIDLDSAKKAGLTGAPRNHELVDIADSIASNLRAPLDEWLRGARNELRGGVPDSIFYVELGDTSGPTPDDEAYYPAELRKWLENLSADADCDDPVAAEAAQGHLEQFNSDYINVVDAAARGVGDEYDVVIYCGDAGHELGTAHYEHHGDAPHRRLEDEDTLQTIRDHLGEVCGATPIRDATGCWTWQPI